MLFIFPNRPLLTRDLIIGLRLHLYVRVSQLNCRSFLSKFPLLEQLLLYEWRSDFMFFSETWLRPYSTLEIHFRIDNYKIFRRDRLGRSGGGLLVYSKNSLDTCRRHDLEDDRIERLTVELSTKRTNTNDKCFFLLLSTSRSVG